MNQDLTTVCLKEFIQTFEASLDPRVWSTFIGEEEKELRAELDDDIKDRVKILKEATDLMYVTVGFNLVAIGPEQLGLFSAEEYDRLMALVQKSSKTHEEAIEYLGDVDYIEAFRRVHKSNMSKVGEDGKVLRREDGKILKGPNYKEPDLSDVASLVIGVK